MGNAAWKSMSFRLLLTGRALSSIGDVVVSVALPFAVLDLTGSVKDLGLVLAARALPLALFVLVGGVWSDRLPRRVVMLAADAIRAGAQLACGLLVLAATKEIWPIVALQFLYGSATAFFMPASVAIVPETVAEGDLQSANSLLSISENFTSIGGAALAGVIVVAIGAGWGLVVDSASFVASACLLAALRVRAAALPERGASMLAELRAGWRAFLSYRWLAWSVPSFMVVNALSFCPWLVLGPTVAKESYNGAATWAVLLTLWGVGSVIGGVVGARFSVRHPLRFTNLLSLAGVPVALVLLALRAPVELLALAATVSGGTTAYFNLVWFTVLHQRISREELSRVSSWDSLGSFVATPVGFAVTGPVALAIGTTSTLYAAAAVFVLAVLAVLAVPAVWNLGSRPAPAPD
jgi:MFS family permease